MIKPKNLDTKEQNITILIIDDKEMFTSTVATILSNFYRVCTANSHETGLEIIKKNKPQVILISQDLTPETEDILKEIKKINSEIISIVITEYKNMDLILNYINNGLAYHYIKRPINIENLKNIIHRAVLEYKSLNKQKILMQTIKKQNQELSKKNQRLTEINSAITKYIKDLSSNFSDPLTTILLSSEIINSDQNINAADLKLAAESIYKSGLKLKQTLNNLTTLAKIDIHELKIKPEKFYFEEIIKEIQKFLVSFTNKEKINFKVTKEPPNLEISADKNILNLLFVNIFSRLYYYCKEKTSLEWEIKKEKNFLISTITCKYQEKQNQSINSFAEYLTEASTNNTDLSLSLTVAQALVNFLHGNFEINSASQNEFQFFIKLPLLDHPK